MNVNPTKNPIELKTVVHVSTVHPRRDTRIFYRECASLLKHGYQVILIVADGEGDEVFEGIQVLDLGLQSARVKNFTKGYSKIKRRIRQLTPALVHFHDPELMIVGRAIHKMGIPVVFDIHENIAVQIYNKGYLPKWLRRPVSGIYRIMENHFIQNFHLILAETSYEPVYHAKGKSVTTVLNMPELNHFKPFINLERQGNEVFYIGGVSNERGLDITLKALQLLDKRGVDFFMHYIGRVVDEIDPAQLQSIESRVKFYGRMDSKEGFEISRRCSVGLSVLKPIKNYIESYSTKIFEYMAIGLPVITSNFPLYQNVVEKYDTGFCVDPYSAEELADRIEILIQNPAMVHDMGSRGIKVVGEHFNWASEEKKLFDLYEEILHS